MDVETAGCTVVLILALILGHTSGQSNKTYFLRIKAMWFTLQVIGLAVFFALVIKNVDEEDFQDVAFEKVEKRPGHVKILPKYIFTFPQILRSIKLISATFAGDQNSQTMSRRAACLYEPPPPSDIEKMKKKMIMEQKGFALLTEILSAYEQYVYFLLIYIRGNL